jgi:hypothetical protein
MGVDMRHRMICFVPVHVDGDAIERRDSGHSDKRLIADRPEASTVFEKDQWYLRPRDTHPRRNPDIGDCDPLEDMLATGPRFTLGVSQQGRGHALCKVSRGLELGQHLACGPATVLSLLGGYGRRCREWSPRVESVPYCCPPHVPKCQIPVAVVRLSVDQGGGDCPT